MGKPRRGEDTTLGSCGVTVGPESSPRRTFRLGSARSATFILLLASREPRSFISGAKVDLAKVLQAYNRHEFHHVYPLRAAQGGWRARRRDQLPRQHVRPQASGQQSDPPQAPSEYRELMPDGDELHAVLAAALTTERLFADDFEAFRQERSHCLPTWLSP